MKPGGLLFGAIKTAEVKQEQILRWEMRAGRLLILGRQKYPPPGLKTAKSQKSCGPSTPWLLDPAEAPWLSGPDENGPGKFKHNKSNWLGGGL